MKCIDCGGPTSGQRRCAIHAETHRRRERTRWRRKHRCHNCEKPPLRGQRRCAEHAAWNRNAQLLRDQRKRLNGVATKRAMRLVAAGAGL